MPVINTLRLSLNALRRHWVVLMVGYVLVLMDPFDVGSTTSKAVTDAFDRMVSPFYTLDLRADSTDLVDVILIDDPSIKALSSENVGYLSANDWPLAYSDHLVLIDALRRQGYGTVLLDITFYRARRLDDSFNELVKRLDYFREHLGVNVILSAGANPDDIEDSMQPLVQAASAQGLTAWSGYADAYPLGHEFPDGTYVPTLAVAGYAAFCAQTGRPGCENLSEADSAWLVPEPKGMHLNWGMPATRVTAATGCYAQELGNAWSELVSVLFRNMSGAEALDGNARQTCPPAPTATLRDVLCTGENCDKFFDGNRPGEGRIAVVGVSLPSARDLFDPPIPGRLPGVYLHAEALRNLLHYGSDYFKPIGLELNLGFIGQPQWTLPVDVLVAWPLLLLGMVLLSRRVRKWRWRAENPREIPELVLETGEILLALVLLIAIYALAIQFNRTPGPLAEVIGLIPLLIIVVRKERKEMEHEKLRALTDFAGCSKQPGRRRLPAN
ncbi:MAG: CHASE2 domain-containing protein [Marinobacter sp.]|uniref:CHASE2 domain-containing protein n=1 Tax=Marinobacter sp. TaxID=50741 RepID=UPI0032976751